MSCSTTLTVTAYPGCSAVYGRPSAHRVMFDLAPALGGLIISISKPVFVHRGRDLKFKNKPENSRGTTVLRMMSPPIPSEWMKKLASRRDSWTAPGESCPGITVVTWHLGSLEKAPRKHLPSQNWDLGVGRDGVFSSWHPGPQQVLEQSQENTCHAVVNCQACVSIL